MKLKRHPLSQFYGNMPESRFEELKKSIQQTGQRLAIVVMGDAVLDGWHRYRACGDLGIKPKIEKFRGTASEVADLVVSLNAHRRDQTESQRAFAVTASYEWAKGKGDPGHPSEAAKTNEELAAAAGTSTRTIQRAKRVHESGSAELKRAVQSGDVTVKEAATVTSLPKAEQLKTVVAEPSFIEGPPEGYEPEDDEEYQERIERVMMADDKLAAMREELKKQQIEIAQFKRSRDHYMTAQGEAVRQLKKALARVARLEKERQAA